ncbi:MAG TPA: CHASE3 domain-containing protein [Pyrinomonadaceae bacterium]|nr:CHASE3 domain-containing protein [Pyrinomonadaceae bacterium]
MKLTLEKQIPIIFLMATVLLIVIIFFASRSIKSVNQSLELQSHTQEVLLQLDEVLITTLDTETNGRGFLITADEVFLESYNQAQSKIGQNIAKLRELVDDNQNQKNRIPPLEIAVNERLGVLRSAVELRRTKSLEEVLAQSVSGRGREKMNNVRTLLDEMETEERNLLEQRNTELITNRNTAYGLIFFAGLAGIISLGLANFAIFREIKKRRSAEDDLREANKDLEKRVEERTQEILQKNDELKEQIKQREETENRHRLALNAGNLGTWMVNPHTNKSEIDERGLSLFGFSAEDFDGNTFGRVYEEDAPRINELFQNSISKKEFFNAEFRVLTADGKVRWNNCVGQPVLDESGNIAHIVGNCRDVTEIKENEIELRNSEEFTRSIFENSPDCVKVLELDGTLHSINKNGLQIMEIEDFKNLNGKNWIDAGKNEKREMVFQAVKAAREGKSARFEGFRRTVKGTPKYWDILVSPIFDAKGNPVRLIATLRDITERREIERERETLLKSEQAARKEAEIANRLRDEFLATVSHELRAPLNSILGWGKLLIKGNLDQTTSDKAIQTIVRNAESQNHLIEDLLDVSRIISGKLRLEIITINPIIFVESALESVRPAAEAKNITLEVKQDSVVSHISGDPNRLQQVIWNLLSNAIKFTPAGGKVSVEIERMKEHTEIRVCDSGVGISEEFLPHVFDRFRQADASSIRKFGGLGLGLAIVRHLVEMHGGTVSATSEGENQGSTFTVKLPVTSVPKDVEDDEIKSFSKVSTQNDAPKLSLDGLLILVVDDEEDTRQMLVQSLTFYGATVITAKSAAEGLEQLQGKNPDVLVSDIGMPEEDGYSLIKKIRALENEHH